MIDVPTADGLMPAYRVSAAEEAPIRPPVVLIHEGFGLTPHTRTVADRLAARGHDVIAPHFYYRKTRDVAAYDDIPLAVELTTSVKVPEILMDFDAAAAIVARGDEPVLTMGFCFGGAVAYIAAALSHRVDRAVSYYPVSIRRHWEEVGRPVRPMLVFFGDADEFITHEEQDWVGRLAGQPGLDVEVRVFPDAPHGFFNEVGPNRYDATAAEHSWAEAMAFFDDAAGEGR